MAASIQHGFWANGTTDGIQDYADALNAGIAGANGTTPIGQVKYYQYRLNRPYDFVRWRQAQGFQENGHPNPSVADYDLAKFLLGQTVPGHTHAAGVQGTIIALEYTWRTTSPKVGITAASLIRGNFDFGPRARLIAGVSQNGSNAAGIGGIAGARWAARPQNFTAPTFGVSYGARSYTGGNFPTDDSWLTSFNRDSHRSGSPGSYTNTAGTVSLEAGSDECYSLWELGLDILYLTSLYPDAVFMMDHVLEVNINHGVGELDDIPQDVNPDTALTRANYSDALLHIISFLEAMGVTNVLHHIGIAGVNFWGGAIGNNESDPWWGNILAQEKNDSAYGVINPNYDTGRTWVDLAGRDMYSGQNGATQYRSPADLVNTVVAWAHQMDKYVTIYTTGVTHLMDSNTPASGGGHATYPKDGALRQSGTPVDGDNFFSAFRWEGDQEMNVASPRLWGVCYQIGFESQDPHNDYNPESDSDATNRGSRASPLPAPPITAGNVYGTPYDRTILPPANARSGWRAFWDWLNAPKWYGGTPLLLPAFPPTSVSHTTDALIRAKKTRVHTTMAIISKVATRTHQTDARLSKVLTRTHQTDAVIQQGTQQRSHGTDAVVRKTLTRSHGTDAFLYRFTVASADGWGPMFWGLGAWGGDRTFVAGHSTDAMIKTTTKPTHSTDARILKVTKPAHTTDALIRKVATKTHSTDAILRATGLVAHQTDAYVKPLAKVSHTTDAYVSLAGRSVHQTDGVIAKTLTKTHSTDAVLLRGASLAHGTDAVIAARVGRSHQTDGVIAARVSVAHSTDAQVLGAGMKVHSTDALIRTDLSLETHGTDAVIRVAFARAHFTDAFIGARLVIEQRTDALILGIETPSHQTDAIVLGTLFPRHETDAYIFDEYPFWPADETALTIFWGEP